MRKPCQGQSACQPIICSPSSVSGRCVAAQRAESTGLHGLSIRIQFESLISWFLKRNGLMLEADKNESPPLSLTPNRGARWWLALCLQQVCPLCLYSLGRVVKHSRKRDNFHQSSCQYIYLNGTSDRFHRAQHRGKWSVNVDGPSNRRVWWYRGLMAAPSTLGQSRGVDSPRPPNRGSWNLRERTQTRANRDESANHSTAGSPPRRWGVAVVSPKLTHEYFHGCCFSCFQL